MLIAGISKRTETPARLSGDPRRLTLRSMSFHLCDEFGVIRTSTRYPRLPTVTLPGPGPMSADDAGAAHNAQIAIDTTNATRRLVQPLDSAGSILHILHACSQS
jgi:hypothetical protein